MKKVVKFILGATLIGLFGVLAFCSIPNTETVVKEKTKSEKVQEFKQIMEIQKISIEKLESVELPKTRATIDTIKTFWDPWPICGTRRAAVLKQYLNDNNLTIEDIK